MAGEGEPLNPADFGDAQKMQRENDAKMQRESSGRENYGRGQSLIEIVRSSDNPLAIRGAVRDRIAIHEKMETGPSQVNPFDIRFFRDVIEDRTVALGYSKERLLSEGIIRDVGGKVEFLEPGFALRTKKVPVEMLDSRQRDKAGNVISETWRHTIVEEAELGTDDERNKLKEEFKNLGDELDARIMLHQTTVFDEQNTDNLAGLVGEGYYDLNWSKGINIILNAPERGGATNKLATGVELRPDAGFGDKVDAAMRLYEIVGLSEKPTELLELMKKPGFKMLFPEGQKGEEEKLKWLGKVDDWEKGEKFVINFAWPQDGAYKNVPVPPPLEYTCRHYGLINDNRPEGEKKFLGKEHQNRGPLTQWGNIFASLKYYEGEEETRQRVRDFLVGNPNSEVDKESAKQAEELAWRFFRVLGLRDDVGWEVYYDDRKERSREPGKIRLQLLRDDNTALWVEMDMGPAATDRQKLMHNRFYELIYRYKERNTSPAGTRFLKEPYMTDFMKTTFKTLKVTNSEGIVESQNRTLEELWWGYSDEKYGEKNAMHLGEMKIDKITKKICNAWLKSGFLAVKGKGNGSFELFTQTKANPEAMEDPTFWGDLHKMLNIGRSEAVRNHGVLRKDKQKSPRVILRKGDKDEEVHYKDASLEEVKQFWDGIRSTQDYKYWWQKKAIRAYYGSAIEIPLSISELIQRTVWDELGIMLDIGPLPHNKQVLFKIERK